MIAQIRTLIIKNHDNDSKDKDHNNDNVDKNNDDHDNDTVGR